MTAVRNRGLAYIRTKRIIEQKLYVNSLWKSQLMSNINFNLQSGYRDEGMVTSAVVKAH